MDRRSAQDRLLDTVGRVHPFTTAIRILLDLLAWAVAAAFAIYLRFNLSFGVDGREGLIRFIPLVATVQVLTGYAVGLYRRRWRYGSYDEVGGARRHRRDHHRDVYVLNEVYFDTPRPIPQSAVLVGGVFGLVLMAGIRYLWRLALERLRRPTERTAEKLLVFGAGEGGIQVITSLLRSRSSPYVPVGLLDDDPVQAAALDHGGLGGRRSPRHGCGPSSAPAPPHCSSPSRPLRPKMIGELADLATDAGLSVKVLPACDRAVRPERQRRRHPGPQRGRPARPAPDPDRSRADRRLPHQSTSARHRCRRQHRQRAVPHSSTASARPS